MANLRAQPSPIPEEAPVMSTIFFSIMLLSFNINTANKGITYYFNFIGIMNFRVRRKIPINYVTLHPLFESPRNCFDFISAFF
jgi:hypothetical protein